MSVDPQTGYRIRVTGNRFDAGPLIDYLKQSGTRMAGQSAKVHPEQHPEFDFDIRLETMTIAESSDLNQFSAWGSIDEDGLQNLSVSAEMKAAADVVTKVELTYTTQGEENRFHFETENVGGIVAGFHGSTMLAGGTAKLDATRASRDAPFTGGFQAGEFTLLQSPDLGKILELGSIRGMDEAFHKEGLRFKTVSADFTLDERRLEIRNGKALGHGFGITVEGSVDFNEQSYDLAGAVTPMETIQKIIGHIPLLGRLLAGWDREGVIAFLYTVKGPLKNPDIDVKGYSALTPGITREIFKLTPDGSEADDGSGKK